MGGLGGEEEEIEAVGAVGGEVVVESHETEVGGDGKGGEVGVHPNLGRGGVAVGESGPAGLELGGLGDGGYGFVGLEAAEDIDGL